MNPETESDFRPVQIRLWPAILLVLGFLSWYILPGYIAPRSKFHFFGTFTGVLLCVFLFGAWWMFFSRAPKKERWPYVLAVLLCSFGVTLSQYNQPRDIGMFWGYYGLPLTYITTTVFLLLTYSLAWPIRKWGMVATVVVVWAGLSLVRIVNIGADLIPKVAFRFSKTAEEKLLESVDARRPKDTALSRVLTPQPGDWLEFRGSGRTGIQPNGSIRTDWAKNPPRLIWKQPVGPGWSSFTHVEGHLFTQEQRGPSECIVAYVAETGKEIWEYGLPQRFEEAMSGAGPRATPTFSNGRLYCQTASSFLVCLDASSGAEIWKQDIRQAGEAQPPMWGFAASPLVHADKVFTVAGGKAGKGMVAYDAATGKLLWANGQAAHTYSSPQLTKIAGVDQILLLSDFGLESFQADDGKILWTYAWTDRLINRVVQPAIAGEGEILIGTGTGNDQGTRQLKITLDGDKWNVKQGWFSKGLRPYFNDFILADGYAYGFNDAVFTCIRLKDGKTMWKGERYGHGQVLYIAEAKVCLIATESGKVALVSADPTEANELSLFPALESRTWNHPVVIRGKLFIRNNEEMACYEIQ